MTFCYCNIRQLQYGQITGTHQIVYNQIAEAADCNGHVTSWSLHTPCGIITCNILTQRH